jgi:hypothetical protein
VVKRPRWIRWPWLLAAIAAVIAVAGVVVWRSAGSSDPVSRDEALAAFRAAGGGAGPAVGPAPGVYSYVASGSETGGVGPFAITRALPAEARLVVTPRADGWDAELDYSRQHIESMRVVSDGGALKVTFRRTKVTFAGFGSDDRREVEPPSLFLPANPAPGMRWRESYRTGDINVRADNRIVRRERVRVGGRDVDVVVMTSSSVTDGPHPGTREETIWWAPALALPVRWDVDMDIGGTFAFKARSSVRLTSVAPEV